MVDTHVHTQASYDSSADPGEMVRSAERAGLDGIVVTDHDTVDGARAAAELSTDSPLTVIVGCEVSTADGHLLAIGVDSAPRPGRPLAATAERIREDGGIAVVPHPFQLSRHGASARAISAVNGIESLNAQTILNVRNEQAARFARRHGYARFGGSDAHRPRTVGQAATEVSLERRTECTAADIVAALRAGRTRAVGTRISSLRYVGNLLTTARLRTPSLR